MRRNTLTHVPTNYYYKYANNTLCCDLCTWVITNNSNK